jgi:hypothetical protein
MVPIRQTRAWQPAFVENRLPPHPSLPAPIILFNANSAPAECSATSIGPQFDRCFSYVECQCDPQRAVPTKALLADSTQRRGGKQILTMILDIRCTLLIIDIKYWDWDGWPPNCRAKSFFVKVFYFSVCEDAPHVPPQIVGCHRTSMDIMRVGQRNADVPARRLSSFGGSDSFGKTTFMRRSHIYQI